MSSIYKLEMLGTLRRFGAMTGSDFADEEARPLEQPAVEGGPSAEEGSGRYSGDGAQGGEPGRSGSPL